jgi:hypothetical protein
MTAHVTASVASVTPLVSRQKCSQGFFKGFIDGCASTISQCRLWSFAVSCQVHNLHVRLIPFHLSPALLPALLFTSLAFGTKYFLFGHLVKSGGAALLSSQCPPNPGPYSVRYVSIDHLSFRRRHLGLLVSLRRAHLHRGRPLRPLHGSSFPCHPGPVLPGRRRVHLSALLAGSDPFRAHPLGPRRGQDRPGQGRGRSLRRAGRIRPAVRAHVDPTGSRSDSRLAILPGVDVGAASHTYLHPTLFAAPYIRLLDRASDIHLHLHDVRNIPRRRHRGHAGPRVTQGSLCSTDRTP